MGLEKKEAFDLTTEWMSEAVKQSEWYRTSLGAQSHTSLILYSHADVIVVITIIIKMFVILISYS